MAQQPYSNNTYPLTVAAQAILANALETYITGQGSQKNINQNIINAIQNPDATDALGFDTAVLQIVPAAGTVTGGVISFEASNDNVTFFSVTCLDLTTLSSVSSITLAASTNRLISFPISVRYIRARISTAVTGTTTGVQCFTILKKNVNTIPAGIATAAGQDLLVNAVCYRSSFDLAVVTGATDYLEIIGSASKQIIVTAVNIRARSTAGAIVLRNDAIKRVNIDSGGTFTSPACLPDNPSAPAATGLIKAYTANPTINTTGQVFKQSQFQTTTVLTAVPSSVLVSFKGVSSNGLYLANATESLAINLGGVAVVGLSLQLDVQWFEM